MVIRLAADELFLATLIGCVTYRRLAWPDIIDYKPRYSRARLWHSKIYSNDVAFNFDFELKMEYFMLYISYMILCHSLILDHLLKFTHHHPTLGNA